MTFFESIQTCFKKYADFSGRASRSEFWWFLLAVQLCPFLIFLIFSLPIMVVSLLWEDIAIPGFFGIALVLLFMLSQLAIIIPLLAVAARRLHDANRTGWWLLICFVPFGFIVLLIFFIQKSNADDNQYGPNPL